MLKYSYYTVLTAVLAGGMIVLLNAFCLRHKKISHSMGHTTLTIFSYLTLARYAFPFTVQTSQSVCILFPVPEFLASFWHTLTYPGGMPLSLGTVLCLIWAGGFLCLMHKRIKEFLIIRRHLEQYGIDATAWEPYAGILRTACAACGCRADSSIRVFITGGITVPCICGMRRPLILIPDKMHLSEEDLYCVFCHELSHHSRRDILRKYTVGILSAVYWWNPLIYTLQKQMNLLSEIRADSNLTETGIVPVSTYMRALIHIAEEAAQLQDSCAIISSLDTFFAHYVTGKSSGNIVFRFEWMQHRSSARRYCAVKLLMTVLVVIFLAVSYMIELAPAF